MLTKSFMQVGTLFIQTRIAVYDSMYSCMYETRDLMYYISDCITIACKLNVAL